MKQNERIIKKGDYYELQTIQDIMLQQKVPKKQEMIIQQNSTAVNENILTQLPSRKNIMKNYHIGFNANSLYRTGTVQECDGELAQYQENLENLLKTQIRDEQRLEIQKLLQQINQVKNSQLLPLNSLPTHPQPPQTSPPKSLPLQTKYSTKSLLSSLDTLQQIKTLQLSKLQTLTQILLGEYKEEPPLQLSQIDAKSKEEIQGLYNNLNQLKCVKNLGEVVMKIGANQIKYVQIMKEVQTVEEVFGNNKSILEEFQADAVVLGELEEKFKANIAAVRAIIKKLSQ